MEHLFEIRTCEWTSEACLDGTPEKAGGWRSQTRFESRSRGTAPHHLSTFRSQGMLGRLAVVYDPPLPLLSFQRAWKA